jgi:hypothetical protein
MARGAGLADGDTLLVEAQDAEFDELAARWAIPVRRRRLRAPTLILEEDDELPFPDEVAPLLPAR